MDFTLTEKDGYTLLESPVLPTYWGGINGTLSNQADLQTALDAKVSGLVPTAVKTGNYTAAVSDLVPVNTTSGAVTVTLPTAPSDHSMVAVKHVIQGSTNAVTITAGGADVFNKTGGGTSLTLPLLNQAVLLQYKASGAIWYVLADDLSLASLDARFATAAQGAKADTAIQSIATPGVIFTNPVTVSSGAATLALINQAANTFFGNGTGSSAQPTFMSAGTARTALSLVVGTNVEAWSANLDTFAGIAPTANAQTLLGHTFAQMKTDLAITESDVSGLVSDLALKAPLASPALTGTPSAPTAAAATNTTQIATTAFVTGAITTAVTGLLNFKGSTDCSGNPNYPAAVKGDAYIVSVAGKIGGASGTAVDVGDWYVADANNAGGTEVSVGTSWGHMEHNLVGALLAANNLSDVASASAARTNLGLAIGTNVQAWDADLDTWATITPAAGVGTFLATPTLVNLKAAVTDETTAGWNLLTLANPGAITFLKIAADNSVSAESATTHRTSLGLAIGANVQAWDTDLDTWALTTPPSSYAVGDLLYASAANTLSKLADVATGNALISGGVTTAPSWGKVTSSHVDSTIPLKTDNLSVFAATTSAQLAGVLSDESGTGGGFVRSAGGALTALTGLAIRSTGAAFDLTFASSEVLTAGRTLSFNVGDAARTITLSGSPSLSGITATGTGTLALSTFTLTASHNITLDTDGTGTRTLNIGAGGTLGTAAFTTSSAYATSAQGTKADTAVQSLTVTTGNGVSGSFTSGTTPALSLTLGAITPSLVSISGSTVPYLSIHDSAGVSGDAFLADYYVSATESQALLTVNRNPANGAFTNTSSTAAQINLIGKSGDSSIHFQTSPTNNTAPVDQVVIDKNGGVTMSALTASSFIETDSNKMLVSKTAAQMISDLGATGWTFTTPVINGLATGTGVAAAATASTLVTRDANANITANNLLDGYTTAATAAGTTTLTVSSTYAQYFTGSTTQTVKLPVASTLVLGQSFLIVNNSSGAVTVQSSGTNAIQVLSASSAGVFTCILTSGTTAASWDSQYRPLLTNVENTALSTWAGTANVTTLGTIGTGTWQGTVVGSTYGGTGVNNAGRTLTINTNSGTLAFPGASTTMTFPSTSATIARTDAANTFTGVQTMTSPSISGTSTSITNVGTFALRDTSAAFDVTLAAVSSATLTAGRTLTLDMGNVAHTLAFGTTANTITFPNAASGTVPLLNLAQTWAALQSFGTNLGGTLQTAAQTNVTSLGTLTGLTVSAKPDFQVNAAAQTSALRVSNLDGSGNGPQIEYYTGFGTKVVATTGAQATGGSGSTFLLQTLVGGSLTTILTASVGIQVGAPTGGDKGAGTANFAGDIYKNNAAYTNPDYVLEKWATGKIEKFADKEGAATYDGLRPIEDVEALVRTEFVLPRIAEFRARDEHGLFAGGDAVLASLEEAYLYIFDLERRLRAVERTRAT